LKDDEKLDRALNGGCRLHDSIPLGVWDLARTSESSMKPCVYSFKNEGVVLAVLISLACVASPLAFGRPHASVITRGTDPASDPEELRCLDDVFRRFAGLSLDDRQAP